MDVKYINPFINGTLEVLKKMAFIDAVPGKPYLKKDEFAHGDVSGIIGITGDAIGSLSLSFSEECICGIVSNMLGEEYHSVNADILDAVGEITNMVSGASRTQLEKMGMSVFAAIPTVIHGKNHTITHILKSPSIVLPFSTRIGKFVVDFCIKTTDESIKSQVRYGVVNTATVSSPGNHSTAVKQTETALHRQQDERKEPSKHPITAPKTDTPLNGGRKAEDSSKIQENKGEFGSKIEILKSRLKESIAKRDLIMKQLNEQPFMEYSKRKNMNKEMSILDQKIDRLKLDIKAVEMLSNMSEDDLNKPTIPKHYQNYSNNRK
jgi:chemotaxis protein CheX